MFRDGQWLWQRAEDQQTRMREWMEQLAGYSLVVVECGAGEAVPTVRRLSEQMQGYGATLVRINPREADGPDGCISIGAGAEQSLRDISAVM